MRASGEVDRLLTPWFRAISNGETWNAKQNIFESWKCPTELGKKLMVHHDVQVAVVEGVKKTLQGIRGCLKKRVLMVDRPVDYFTESYAKKVPDMEIIRLHGNGDEAPQELEEKLRRL